MRNKVKSKWCMCGVFLVIFFAAAIADAAVYNSQGKRDPLVPLVGAAAQGVIEGLAGVNSIENVKLQGIVTGATGEKAAVINGEIMYEGGRMGNLSVESIGENEVVVKFNDTKHTLKLYQ
ncbi:MAG TPA: hypothetical protein PKY78_07135 [Candidatus Omnitrophota bacterium]|nr:hypothetical protein [Candidatus Omnitrophota bacterium]HPS20740.1 hypothetical protein [Candidatus Omnitrophota bacterium]